MPFILGYFHDGHHITYRRLDGRQARLMTIYFETTVRKDLFRKGR